MYYNFKAIVHLTYNTEFEYLIPAQSEDEAEIIAEKLAAESARKYFGSEVATDAAYNVYVDYEDLEEDDSGISQSEERPLIF